MKKLFQERQQAIIFCLTVVIVGGFVFFRYLPLHRGIKSIRQEGAAQRLAVTKALGQSGQLSSLGEQLQKLQREVEDYELNVPVERELGVFLQQVTNLMNEQGLGEQLLQPDKEIMTEKLNCIPVSMQCKGRLEQIFEFYKRLQGLDRLVRIEQVNLVNDRDFGGEVSMQTKAVIYYRPNGVKS